jgi:hypothetical protein
MQAPPLPKKTYFAVLGNFDENNIPRGKIYSTGKLAKSEFFGQITTEQLSAEIQIDDLYEEEETAGTPPLPVTPPVTPISPPSTPVKPEQKNESPPPIPPASVSQSPINVAHSNTIPPLSETEKTYVEEMKRAQRTNLPEGELIQLPTEETKEEAKIQVEEEKKDVSETQPKYTLATLKKQLIPLINKSKQDPAGNTKGITGMLSKIARVDDETERNELFESFIQKLYDTKINDTNQRLYDVHKSVIDKYSSYVPVKPNEPRKTREVKVTSTSETKTDDDNTPTNKNEPTDWKTAK